MGRGLGPLVTVAVLRSPLWFMERVGSVNMRAAGATYQEMKNWAQCLQAARGGVIRIDFDSQGNVYSFQRDPV